MTATFLQAASGFLYRITDLLILETANHSFTYYVRGVEYHSFRVVLTLADKNWNQAKAAQLLIVP